MPLPPPTILKLVVACAPAVAPGTMRAIVQVESGGDPLAIRVNGSHPQRLHPRDQPEAVRLASSLLAHGANIDLGLGQISSRNLSRLRLTLADTFDPCRNLRAAAEVLAEDFEQSTAATIAEQAALRTSLSRYNTGDPERGFRNGYVGRVSAAARQIVPELGWPVDSGPTPAPRPPSWDIFAIPADGPLPFVIHPSIHGDTP